MPDSFSRRAEDRYFEDYPPGAVFEFGAMTVDAAEMMEFALRFDPQYFHTDDEAARSSMFGGLIASGWHTAAMCMRLLVDYYLPKVASLASPGLDELRWLAPVRPGDTLRVRVTVLDGRLSSSKPDRGIVRSLVEVINQRGVTVMTVKAVNLILTRAARAKM